jgi:teichuronic acid biosynthesis glycosyltransferase TuaC
MRILFISNLFPYAADKTYGVYTGRQVEMTVRLGADITVLFTIVWIPQILQQFSPKYKDYNKKHTPVEYSGVKVTTIPYVRLTRGAGCYRRDGFCIFRAAKKKVGLMHKEKPFDIIYGKGIFPSADAAVRFSRLLNIPAVAEGIGGDVNILPDYSPALYKHFLRITHALAGAVADGKGVSDRLSNVMKMEIPTIHGLVDTKTFQPAEDKTALRCELNIPTASLALLFVGHVTREKGIYELLAALGKIRENLPHAVLNICGSSTEHKELSIIIAKHNLSHSVRLVGTVDPADMHKWMQASDIFVLPSYTEGMPNAVMEAMACGLPVISTTVGGLPEAIGDCKGAILIEPKNADQLASAIIKVGTNKGLYEQMGDAARRTAEQRFGAEKNCKKLLTYLESVIEKKKHLP